jgi:hypothetical protein
VYGRPSRVWRDFVVADRGSRKLDLRAARLQHQPVFRQLTQLCPALRRAVIRRDQTSAEETLLSLKQFVAPGSAGAMPEKRPRDESAVKQLVTVTSIRPRSAVQAARRSYR